MGIPEMCLIGIICPSISRDVSLITKEVVWLISCLVDGGHRVCKDMGIGGNWRDTIKISGILVGHLGVGLVVWIMVFGFQEWRTEIDFQRKMPGGLEF